MKDANAVGGYEIVKSDKKVQDYFTNSNAAICTAEYGLVSDQYGELTGIAAISLSITQEYIEAKS